MYGRLRGVPSQYLEPMVDNLLQRLGLGQYADRVCDSYSGGNKRKLSVAIALVGDPPAVLMDEPSTGMDPGAKRFLWDLIQKQVVDAGRFQEAFSSQHSPMCALACYQDASAFCHNDVHTQPRLGPFLVLGSWNDSKKDLCPRISWHKNSSCSASCTTDQEQPA